MVHICPPHTERDKHGDHFADNIFKYILLKKHD